MTITEAGTKLRARQISCLELVEEALRGIRRDAHLNAVITETGDQARDRARALDTELRAGKDRGPLHGIPVALKDLFFTRGVRTTNGSKVFERFVPDHDGTVVSKLEAAGAVSVAKLNMHEMAYGITSNNPHFGPVRNPHNPDHIPGGSSGGSGVLVQTGAVFAAMGSDTGGSIRIPASYCGTFGLKPTFGRVSRHGCFQLGLTLDHMGPLTRTASDAALVLEAIAGPDGIDESVVPRSDGSFVPGRQPGVKGVRIGVPDNFYNERVHEDVWRGYSAALQAADSLGATLVPVRAPDPEELTAIARVVLLAEASSVLTPHLHRRQEFGADVLALLDQGCLVPATDYINAQRLRRLISREWVALYQRIDVLFTPATPLPAPKIGQTTTTLGGQEEDTRLASTRFCRGINVLGFPAVSLQCGMSAEGLPVGMQMVGPAWSEARLLEYSAALEPALGFTPAPAPRREA